MSRESVCRCAVCRARAAALHGAVAVPAGRAQAVVARCLARPAGPGALPVARSGREPGLAVPAAAVERPGVRARWRYWRAEYTEVSVELDAESPVSRSTGRTFTQAPETAAVRAWPGGAARGEAPAAAAGSDAPVGERTRAQLQLYVRVQDCLLPAQAPGALLVAAA